MSVAVADLVLDRPRAEVRQAGPVPGRERVRPRRPGPGVGPVAHPRRLRFVAPTPARARACVAPPAPEQPRSWRLTQRGVAAVLVVAAALVAASVVVVGLTALRVTGDGYRAAQAAPPVVVAEQ